MAANYQMLFELNAALGGGFTSAFTQGAQQMDNMKAKLDALNAAGSTGDILGGVSAALETAGVIQGLEMVYDSLKQCTEAAAAFENSMAGVKRTVGGDDAFIEGLGESFKKLSTEIPITADELAGIATTAGQLGIAQNNVEVFTTVMAQLGTTTDLTADSAATMLAQFANITGTTDYERLGSTVAALGDSTATTASKVVEMSQGMAAAASQAGMSERDILAISAAVGSLGIEAASGSTSMSTLISTLYKATETGNKLEEFASVAGMSADQFKESWGKDAVGTMNAFIQGLNDTERNGRSAVVILDELGIKNVRQTKAILGLASAGDLLSNTINLANSAWEKNTALSEKAGVMYNTTEAKLTMLQNAANNVKISIGDALTPVISSAAEGLTNLLQPLAEFIGDNPAIVQGLTAFVGVLGLATAAVGAYTAITKLAAAANALFGASIPGVGIIMGVAAAVGGLVYGISALTDAYNDAHPSFEQLDAEFDALNEKAKKQQAIIDLVDTFHDLSEEADNLQVLMEKGFTSEVKFTGTVDDVKKLSPDAFVDGNTVELTAEQASLLAANSFLDGAVVSLTAEQAEFLKAQGFLEDDTVFLHPEEKEKIDAGEFVDGTEVYLTGEMANALAAEGYFTDGTVVELTAEKANELKSSEFMADQEIILTGQAGNTLTAADFGLSDQTLIYLAQMDEPSYEAVAAKAKAISDQMAQMKTDISSAQSTLTSMQGDYAALEEKVAGTKNKKEKAALTEQLEGLGAAISDQTALVETLESKYGELESEFGIASTAVDELAGKKQHLADVTQALRDSSDGMITAADGETEALNREIDALDALAKARKNKFTADALDTIKKQSSQYIQAVNAEEEASAKLNRANVQADTVKGFMAAGNAAEYVRGEFESLVDAAQAYEGEGSWLHDTTDEAVALQERFYGLQETINAITGKKYDFLGSGLAGMGATIKGMNFDTLALGDSLGKASDAAIEFGETAQKNTQIQQEYIQNLVNGIVDGTLKEEELQAAMEEAYSGYENGGEIVADTMEKVRAGVEAARAAAEGSGATAQSEAATTVAAVSDIITQMENLKKAYDDAKASALAALGSRFGIFDEVGKGEEGKSAAEMEKNMTAQENYWKQYNDNLQTALDKGLAPEIAKQLADGSAESAASLKTLANASAEEIQKINSNFAEVQAAKETLASTIADMETNFSEGMASLKTELENTVKELDKGSEAAAAAAETMQAYVEALGEAEGDASAQAQAIADAVNAALSTIADVDVNINYHENGKPSNLGGDVEGENAIGTDYASRGIHLVGEEGPELVMMNGGEKVLTANETVNALSGAGNGGGTLVEMSFPTTYNINGGNAEEIRRVLEERDADMRDQIERVMEDIQTDRIRTRYI